MSEITSGHLKINTEVVNELPPEVVQITLSTGPDSRLYSQRDGGGLGAEQIRMLQVRLAELRTQRPFSRLLVTSATRGEGKTHVAANLALTLAAEDSSRKVLLIDMHVRYPSVHLALGISNSSGFKDWLLNGGNPWKALGKIKKNGLHVMTAGAAALESIGPSRVSCIQALLEQIGPAFDLILIDSPPLLGVVDTKLLTTVADAVLLVVRADLTPRHFVLEAQESLKGRNVLGIVLNRVDPTNTSFSSSYGHTSGGVNGQPKDEGNSRASSPQTESTRITDGKKSVLGAVNAQAQNRFIPSHHE
jgi:capsular exopolysaccharide synthesis family protein